MRAAPSLHPLTAMSPPLPSPASLPNSPLLCPLHPPLRATLSPSPSFPFVASPPSLPPPSPLSVSPFLLFIPSPLFSPFLASPLFCPFGCAD